MAMMPGGFVDVLLLDRGHVPRVRERLLDARRVRHVDDAVVDVADLDLRSSWVSGRAARRPRGRRRGSSALRSRARMRARARRRDAVVDAGTSSCSMSWRSFGALTGCGVARASNGSSSRIVGQKRVDHARSAVMRACSAALLEPIGAEVGRGAVARRDDVVRRRLHLEVPERDRLVEALQVEQKVRVVLSRRADRIEVERIFEGRDRFFELAELLERDAEVGARDGHLRREVDRPSVRGGGLLVLLEEEEPVGERDVRLRVLRPELDLPHELDQRVGDRAGRHPRRDGAERPDDLDLLVAEALDATAGDGSRRRRRASPCRWCASRRATSSRRLVCEGYRRESLLPFRCPSFGAARRGTLRQGFEATAHGSTPRLDSRLKWLRILTSPAAANGNVAP